MNAPPPTDPQITERIASTLELWAKIGGGVAALWVLLSKVWKPYQEFRREQLATQMRAIFAPELAQLAAVFEKEDGCADRLEAVVAEMQELYARQAATFEDLDMFIDIANDNRERHDEHDALMDALGFTSADRRTDEERRAKVDAMMDLLKDRRKERRRGTGEPSHD